MFRYYMPCVEKQFNYNVSLPEQNMRDLDVNLFIEDQIRAPPSGSNYNLLLTRTVKGY